MIKIIKPGKIPDTTKRFKCSRCGCILKLTRGITPIGIYGRIRNISPDVRHAGRCVMSVAIRRIRRKEMLIRIDGPEAYVASVLKKVGVTYQKVTSVFRIKGPGYLERHEILVANIGALPKFMEVLREIPQSNVFTRQPDFEARQKCSELITTENLRYYELPMIVTTMGKRMV